VAVVARKLDLTASKEIVQAARVSLVAEAEEDPGGDVAGGKDTAQESQRRYADAATDEDCAGSFRRKLLRSREGVAQRAVDPDVLALLQLAEPVGAGADALDQEVEADAGCGGSGFGYGEGTRQVGAAVSLLPVGLGGEHVELAGLRLGTLFIEE